MACSPSHLLCRKTCGSPLSDAVPTFVCSRRQVPNTTLNPSLSWSIAVTSKDYISTKMESGVTELIDLIVFCGANSEDHTESKGQVLSEIVDLLEKSGSTYTVLYASDPYRLYPYPSHVAMRFLAKDNSSTNSTHCNAVCQLKSSLLEGFFVGIVLLIILISGLCCMMGIDTPTRFETAPES